MAIAVAYTDLITEGDFNEEALGVLDLEDSALQVALLSSIKAATQRLENHLGRKLIVRQHTDYRGKLEWYYDLGSDATSNTYVIAYAEQWPIVEVESVTPSTASLPTIHADTRHFSTTLSNASTPLYSVTYFAGYRRHEQTLVALQNDLAALGTLPAELPWDIRQAAIDLAMWELVNRCARSLFTTSTQNLPAGAVIVQEALRTTPTDILKSLTPHQSLVY